MRKLIKLVIIRILIVITISIIFLNTNIFISRQEWKHRDGASVGDWIEFDNEFCPLKGRTIYEKDSAVGKVVFCLGKMLIVKEIATGKKGYYINKTNFRF